MSGRSGGGACLEPGWRNLLPAYYAPSEGPGPPSSPGWEGRRLKTQLGSALGDTREP
jgi:hypothetical protein